MPKGLIVAIGVMAGVIFLGSAALLIVAANRVPAGGAGTGTSGGPTFGPSSSASGATGDPLAADPALADLSIPAFSLTDQNGQPVTNEVFTGKLTVVDFLFTNCPLVCPTLAGQMSAVAEKVRDERVQFLSVSVDPERDTPERLREFAANFGADPRWRLARGERDATWRLVREGLKFGIADDPSMPIPLKDGSTMLNIRHPAHFVLVGPKGEILGMYLGTRDEDVEALVARLGRALKAM
jgi:cytochrome oxidase Cu insertion factor (SCO1/SenC/PrrC family)